MLLPICVVRHIFFFFFNDTATTEIYTLSLHDALPISIICFILYLIPGFPKDIISYLFGISPMPFWVFAVVSTIGRLPGTVISSYFGAHVAEQQYIYAIAFLAIVVAFCLPLYYYRDRILKRLHKPGASKAQKSA